MLVSTGRRCNLTSIIQLVQSGCQGIRVTLDPPDLPCLETGKTLNSMLATLHKWVATLGQKLEMDVSPA
jgi:hypothetical protein